jgi:hypothetical protein
MELLHTSAYVSIRQHTSAYVSIRQDKGAAAYRQAIQHFVLHTSADGRMLPSADVCCRMLPYAGKLSSTLLSRLLAVTGTLLSIEAVCCRMLPYADVCCRMLTYAAVC